jgi:hypothetical protein
LTTKTKGKVSSTNKKKSCGVRVRTLRLASCIHSSCLASAPIACWAFPFAVVAVAVAVIVAEFAAAAAAVDVDVGAAVVDACVVEVAVPQQEQQVEMEDAKVFGTLVSLQELARQQTEQSSVVVEQGVQQARSHAGM